jgi:hypothetical protein
LIDPLKAPLLSVNAVVFKSTTPAPKSVSNVTAAFAIFTTPFAVSTVATGSTEPLCAFNVAPLATVTAVLASVPLKVSVPAFTLVAPLYAFEPLKVSKLPLVFTKLPVPLIAPLKVPLLSVNAVVSNVTTPAPNNVCSVTPALNRFTNPSAVSVVVAASSEPLCALNVAPFATVNDVLDSVPLKLSVPAFTLVAPLYAFEPLKVSKPPLAFTRLPAPLIDPLKAPLLSVNAVVFKSTTPAPKSVSNVTAAFAMFTTPLAVSTVATGSTEPLCAFNVAPLATANAVLASVPLKLSVPAFTLVAPLYAFEPLKVSKPPLVFNRLPVPLIAPLKVPLLSVSSVVSNVTTPAPNNVCSVTPALNRFTNPSAVSVVVAASSEPFCAFNTAPFATLTAVLASVPLKLSVPAFTLVAPL